MARIRVYNESRKTTTAVSNSFIDIYMKDANDSQIKVYLYLVRMQSQGSPISVSNIADTFNLMEKDVNRALRFWEKKGLLDLEFDSCENLVSINIHEDKAETAPASANISSISNYIDDFEPEVNRFEKPTYSKNDIAQFRKEESNGLLFFAAEAYLKRPLTQTEIQSLMYFSEVLGFSNELIDYLIEYCFERNKKDFRYIEKVAISWAEQGVSSADDAKKLTPKYDKNIYLIMNQLGKSSSPTKKEVEFIRKWTDEYGFEMDIIIEACERTVLATDSHRIEYADGILKSWLKMNVHHKSDIKALDETFEKKRSVKSNTKSNIYSNNKFNQFTQNEYDFDELERRLLSN